MVLFCAISTSEMRSRDDDIDGVMLKRELLECRQKQLQGEAALLVVASVQKWIAHGMAAQTLERKVMSWFLSCKS